MIYLRQVDLPEERPDCWPYTIPALRGLDRLEFAPVTLLAGDNGTGKSTLPEALAVKLALPAIGRVDAARDETPAALRPLARGMTLTFEKRPASKFFLRSEDFFNFTLGLFFQKGGNRVPDSGAVWWAEAMARFPAAARSDWFGRVMAHLDGFRTPDGFWKFPAAYISEGKDKYFVGGGHMGLGENRRARDALMLESTAWMLRVLFAMEAAQTTSARKG